MTSSLTEKLQSHLQHLNLPRNPCAHPEAHVAAREYIVSQLKAQGRRVELQEFPTDLLDFHEAPAAGINILAGCSTDFPSFLLVAHYDTVDHSPGADDNASAVAVALALGECCPEIALLFPDLEERDLLGSRHFVRSGLYSEVPSLVLESVGYWSEQVNSQGFPEILPAAFPSQFQKLTENDFRGNFWALLHLQTDEKLAEQLAAHLDPCTLLFPIQGVLLQTKHGQSLKDFGRSDHLAFWEKGRTCLMLTDSANFRNPNYHRAGDTMETLSFPQMARLTESLRDFLLSLEKLLPQEHS